MTEMTLQRSAAAPVGSTQPATAQTSTPGKRKRLMAVDAVRGASLLGMIILHSVYESNADGQPTWSFTAFSGRAAAAFAVLSGVGIAFATGRRRAQFFGGRATVAALAARALAIGAIGLLLGDADAVLNAVILPYLAVAFLLAIPLVFLPTWAIAVIGMALAAGMPALSHVLRPQLAEPSLGNATFGYLVTRPVELLTELSITGFYPALSWLAYVCAGLVIGRLDLTKLKVAIALLGVGIVLGVGAPAASSALLHRYGGMGHIWKAQPGSGLTQSETIQLLIFGGDGTTPTSTWWWLVTDARHTTTPLDILGTAGIAIALLGVMLLASRITRPSLRWLITAVQAPLAAVGTLTLTFYGAHIMFINSEYDTYDAATSCLVQVVATLLIGIGWHTLVGRGPLEGIVVGFASRARNLSTRSKRRQPPELPDERGQSSLQIAKNC
ncbi:MAG TPA: heparan-alpha-glucosaminide N-acetyltransferase domain-containing protein [Micromonosporaceae bacterium]|nr:heparan-alpha-glucosaminide N-acetyltransferase domain-containing protein [Micromonosporaceae bacterium]